MASVEHETNPIMGVWRLCPGPGGSGVKHPEAEDLLAFTLPKERQICPVLADSW